jgi:hypothetical protein
LPPTFEVVELEVGTNFGSEGSTCGGVAGSDGACADNTAEPWRQARHRRVDRDA